MIRKSILLIALLGIFSCTSEKKFKIEGKVADAKDSILFLEKVGLDKTTKIDSVKLNESGDFSFKSLAPVNPEFYRIRLGNAFINVAIDSTETVNIETQKGLFGTEYSITGSDNNEKIKQLVLGAMKLKTDIETLQNDLKKNVITPDSFQTNSINIIEAYKQPARAIILENPKSTAAYFALFQQLGDLLIFDPYDKDDYKYFAMVATSFNTFYPESERSKFIYATTLQALKEAKQSTNSFPTDSIPIKEVGYFEISLPGITGKTYNLSSLEGKVILLDFTAYQSEYSEEYNYILKSLYDKYAFQGLEIFQVSLDSEENPWKVTASKLPWVCVRDANSIYSAYAKQYNIQTLPTIFLINRKGEIVKRGSQINNLEEEIKKIL